MRKPTRTGRYLAALERFWHASADLRAAARELADAARDLAPATVERMNERDGLALHARALLGSLVDLLPAGTMALAITAGQCIPMLLPSVKRPKGPVN